MRRKTNQNVLISAAAKGSIWTRLSFLVMGTGCVRYKQYVRGLIYFLTEIGFFYFFRNFALQYLSKFNSLGTETQIFRERRKAFAFVGGNTLLIGGSNTGIDE